MNAGEGGAGAGHPELLQKRNEELAILTSIATALNETVDLPASLGAALSRVAELLNLRAGWIWLLDEVTGEPFLAASQNLPSGLSSRPEAMEGSCYCLDTLKERDLFGAANINMVACSRLKWLTEGTDGLRHHASIPLYARGKKLGVMNLGSPEWRRLSDAELDLLHMIGDMLGIAIERARLFSRSAELGAAEERNRLAREIHDSLAQGLSATALQLETAEALLESDGDCSLVRSAVRNAIESTRHNLEEARRSVLDLRSAPLEGRTLAEALAALCEAVGRADSLTVHCQTIGSRPAVPPRVESGLYRIAQEALANTVRHSRATTAAVLLRQEIAEVTLTVEDNGKGFPDDRTPCGHFGLVGMRERIRLLGGELQVESAPGAGTRVEARVPLL